MRKLNIELLKKQAAPFVPQIYCVDARVVGAPEKVYNWLEDAEYDCQPGEIILRGTVDEEWRIRKDRLSKYELPNGEELKYQALSDRYRSIRTKKSNAVTWMVQIPLSISGSVKTSEGDELKFNIPTNSKGQEVAHGRGDFLCFSDDNGKPGKDCWVVNGLVALNTYKPL